MRHLCQMHCVDVLEGILLLVPVAQGILVCEVRTPSAQSAQVSWSMVYNLPAVCDRFWHAQSNYAKHLMKLLPRDFVGG